MTQVYMLLHQHPLEDGEADEKLLGVYRTKTSGSEGVRRLVFEHPKYVDNVRYIGLFSERSDAGRVIEYLQMKPGFRQHTDGFTADAYRLDKDHWTEGFITTSPDDSLDA